MTVCKILAISIIVFIGLLILIWFFLTLKTLNSVSNVRLLDINGSKFLAWDPSVNDFSSPGLNYIIALNVGGFLSRRRTTGTKIPLFRCDVPVKSTDKGIVVDFVIIARSPIARDSSAVNGQLIT